MDVGLRPRFIRFDPLQLNVDGSVPPNVHGTVFIY